MGSASISRFNSELSRLEESVTRAGLALACAYSTAEEYEAEIISVRRAAGAFDRHYIRRLRILLGVTAGASLFALIVIALNHAI